MHRICKKCGIIKTIDEFYKNRYHCKKCMNKYSMDYIKKRRERNRGPRKKIRRIITTKPTTLKLQLLFK